MLEPVPLSPARPTSVTVTEPGPMLSRNRSIGYVKHAGAWPVLGRDADDSSTRFVYLTIGDLVCRFRGIELARGAIVDDDVTSL